MTQATLSPSTPSDDTPPRVLLGPQRTIITAPAELDRFGDTGRVAVITAGWQEREAEDDDLAEALGGRTLNLRLHARCEVVFAQDRELFAAHRKRQDRLRQMQELYNVRLDHALGAALALSQRSEPPEVLAPELDAAVDAIRTIDDGHLARIQEVHADFQHRVKPDERPALTRQREELCRLVQQCTAVAVAGGHVSTLLNRMRLLDMTACLRGRPIVAWSAGAMVMTERVILFHDRPPEGPGNSELLDAGLGLVPGVVALPHATLRLRTDDLRRMSLKSRRHSPAACVILDGGDGVTWHQGRLTARPQTRVIRRDGHMVHVDSWLRGDVPWDAQGGTTA